MKKSLLSTLPAAAALAMVMSLTGGVAGAASPDTYTGDLKPVPMNTPEGAASGTITVEIDGDQATVTEEVSGLADKLPDDTDTLEALGIPAAFAGMPYPHVQHVHIQGAGSCPSAEADENGDGVISTVEGVPAYGSVGTTLSTEGSTDAAAATDVTVAPGGGSYTYTRTFTMNADTLASVEAGTGVVVVHGLNPETAPEASLSTPSSLDVQLEGAENPLAMIATAPALCAPLVAEASEAPTTTAPQMNEMPSGGADTGGGSTSGIQDGALLGLGALLVTGAGIVLISRRRIAAQD